MTLNFYLDRKSTKTEKTIFVYVRFHKKYILLHTGERLNLKYWMPSKQQAKQSYIGSPELNERLLSIKTTILKIHRDMLNDNPNTTFEEFKSRLYKQFNKDESSVRSFFDVYEKFLELKSNELSVATIKKHSYLIQHLKEFQKIKKYKIRFDTIDLKFRDMFNSYLLKDKNHTNNTIYKYFEFLKTFMRWATERGYNDKADFLKFKIPTDKVDIVYLTENELMTMYNLDLSDNSTLDKARDIFCFSCFTGQRFSDVANLNQEDIRGDKWYLRVQKTKDVYEVPLNDYALAIIDKYKEQPKPLPVLSNQKLNSYIKEIALLAELNEPVSTVRYHGAKADENIYRKYELVTSHTARRTFITLSLEKGMRPEVVMEITGHKDYRTFKKYIKISSKVKSVEMNKTWRKEPVMKAVKVS